jgi:hypothetical protein
MALHSITSIISCPISSESISTLACDLGDTAEESDGSGHPPTFRARRDSFYKYQDRASSFKFALLLLVQASNLSKSRITERCPKCATIRLGSLPLIVDKISGYPLDP